MCNVFHFSMSFTDKQESIYISHVAGVMILPCPTTYIGGLVQERRNSSALAMELCLSCTNPSILGYSFIRVGHHYIIYKFIYTFDDKWKFMVHSFFCIVV